MKVGIFAKTFRESTLDRVLDAIVRHGINLVQFNLACAGVETLPETIGDALCNQIRAAFDTRKLSMVAISGTYNVIDPNLQRRAAMTRRTCRLIERCSDLGTSCVTLCTGTCDPHNMWRAHPGNNDSSAWRAMIATLEKLILVAEAHGVTLGIEPEKANVVNSAVKARRLLDEMQSNYLKIVLDGTNLFEPADLSNMRQVLTEAFDLLAVDIAIVHAKNVTDNPANNHPAAVTGKLDWSTYFNLMHASLFSGPILLHGLVPSQVSSSLAFVRKLVAEASLRGTHLAAPRRD